MQTPGPSHTKSISGTTTGLLDPTQSSRILSAPGSRLSFATFHPRTASAVTRKLSTRDELCSQKRVVIETLVSGESFWRWVPRAKGVENTNDEGAWPRIINICGQLVHCSQEQWDIYKLDPGYICTVRPQPELTTISRSESNTHYADTQNVPSEAPGHKRRVEEIQGDYFPQTKKRRPGSPQSDVRNQSDSEDDDSDEEVVEEMIVDDAMPGAWNEKKRQRQENIRRRREVRREKTVLKSQRVSEPRNIQELSDLSMIDLTIEETPQVPDTTVPNARNSEGINSQSTTMNSQSNATSLPGAQANNIFKRPIEPIEIDSSTVKRTRTRSPSPTLNKKFHPELKEAYRRRREEKQKSRVRKTKELSAQRKDERQRALEEAIRAAAQPVFTRTHHRPNGQGQFEQSAAFQQPPQAKSHPEQSPVIEDPISLEEKIRRMAEIKAYEDARVAKELERRRAEEAAEEKRRKQEEQRVREKIKAEREAREREAEMERRRRLQQEEEEKLNRKQAQEEAQKKAQQQQARWSYGPWTTQRALERYKVLSESFDSAQFTPETPVTFMTVPWPVLHKPTTLTVEDVDWSAVESFFRAVRPHMRSQDYKTLVEKSHRRFHPDRWSARRVLQSVQDSELKACLEVAANTVAQALTPLWRELKST